MKKVAVVISPNWGDYAKKYIDDCIESIRRQDYKGEIKIFITDNETSEASFNFLRKKLPDAEIIRNKENVGYAKGCNDSIRKAIEQKFDYIVVFNIHNTLEDNCLSEMVKVLKSSEKIGAVQARLMLHPEVEKISSLGNPMHFLGFGYCEGYNEVLGNRELKVKDIFYPSGSSILMRRETWERVGLFDEVLWMYAEDHDLGWRVNLSGLRCVLAPDAVMYNKFNFLRSIKKYYWMDRNRIIVILKNYHLLTLLLILPALIVMEFGLFLFSLKTGWWKEKIKMWGYFLNLNNWIYILKARKESQRLRKVTDKKIARLITSRIWYQEVDDWKLRLINPIFSLYWNIAKKLIIW